ncbi:MAG: DUF1801 domain-containing protein [Bacteroidota bacterium]
MKNTDMLIATIDDYIACYPPSVQKQLEQVRKTIRKAAPNAEEVMRYGLPTFKMNKNLVHFGAFQNHIGFYPTSSGVSNFAKELAGYVTTKGAIQFPLGKPIPYDLIEKITLFRVQEDQNLKPKKK